MIRVVLFFGLIISQFSLINISHADDLLINLPLGAQAISIDGKVLIPSEPNELSLINLEKARAEYNNNPFDSDAIIWLGRRTAYTGNYRHAIEIFTEGAIKFPDDPRFFRHRGHRYISIREFDLAIADLEKASQLMKGLSIQIEPDGLPNLQNIPLTTTQGNVWYHLGLAYYLKQDWGKAYTAFLNGYKLGGNDDNLVSTGHWIYMILRRMGNNTKAINALNDISVDMNIIENMSYHQLCLLYKGKLGIEGLMAVNGDNPSSAAVAYGLANYYYYNGDKKKSNELLHRITNGASWSAFGYIAAEVDLANNDR